MGVDLRDTTREFAVSQRQPLDFDSILEHNPAFDTARFLDGTVTAIRTEEYRYQKSEEGAELFALDDEERDVSADRPEVAARLEDDLDEWLNTHSQTAVKSENVKFSGSVRRQLEDLGYLN